MSRASDQFNNSSGLPSKRRRIEQSDLEDVASPKFTQDETGQIYYFPAKILLECENRYLIQWYGYHLTDATWEPKINIEEPELIRNFKIRMSVVNKIKALCKRNDIYTFPYMPNPNPRVVHFLRIQAWENYLNRICQEAQIAPIYVENWVDDDLAPEDFHFIQKNIIHKDVKFEPLEKKSKCKCKADNYCDLTKCCAHGLKTKNSYSSVVHSLSPIVIECWDECKCDRNCPARLIQRGRQLPLVLFKTYDRGWSIRAATFIPKDTFIMAYYGEIIDVAEDERREDKTYIFTTNGSIIDEVKYYVDSKKFGNESRWVNNSCNANLYSFCARIERFKNYGTVAYFSKHDIQVGEELTLNYRPTGEIIDNNIKCHCGAKNCRKYI